MQYNFVVFHLLINPQGRFFLIQIFMVNIIQLLQFFNIVKIICKSLRNRLNRVEYHKILLAVVTEYIGLPHFHAHLHFQFNTSQKQHFSKKKERKL